MRIGACDQEYPSLSSRPDRRRLAALVRDRNAPHKQVWRAEIVLLSAAGVGTNEIMRRTGKSKTCVWRWQERFMQAGYEVCCTTRHDPRASSPGGEHRQTRHAQPDRASSGGDPMDLRDDGERRRYQRKFRPTYLARAWPSAARYNSSSCPPTHSSSTNGANRRPRRHPPAHAVVISVDEKSQIQALDRSQPGLPMKQGGAGTMTHDYKCHRTTTLFAALNVLDGTVIGRNMQRHRHQEFIRFLNTVETQAPRQRMIHAIVDNYATHKHPRCGNGWPGTPLDLPLHSDMGILAQRRRRLLRQAHERR